MLSPVAGGSSTQIDPAGADPNRRVLGPPSDPEFGHRDSASGAPAAWSMCASARTARVQDVTGRVLMEQERRAHTPPVDVIPLGGVGEFGMNMMLVACGDTALLVDAGAMFPEPE